LSLNNTCISKSLFDDEMKLIKFHIIGILEVGEMN